MDKTIELSATQVHILREIAKGKTQQEIASESGRTLRTVKAQLEVSRYKLRARNTTHAIAIAIIEELI